MAHLLSSLLPLILIIAFCMAVFSAFSANIGNEPKVRFKPIMTAAEIKFWHLLREATGPWHIAPQVSMAALLNTATGLDRSRQRSSRNQFDRKMVDFVLLDDAGKVRLLIELDDRTHERASVVKSDAKRDRMTSSAGYKTLRVTGQARHDVGVLRTEVKAALSGQLA